MRQIVAPDIKTLESRAVDKLDLASSIKRKKLVQNIAIPRMRKSRRCIIINTIREREREQSRVTELEPFSTSRGDGRGTEKVC